MINKELATNYVHLSEAHDLCYFLPSFIVHVKLVNMSWYQEESKAV